MSPKLRETAYFTLVISSLDYSSAVWNHFRQKYIDKLEKRSAARFITQHYRQTASVTSLIQNLGWTDLKTRHKHTRLLGMCKILNALVGIPINDVLIPADKTTRGRHNQVYKHLRANTTLGQNSFWHPWLEFSSGSCHRVKNCGSIQESAGWLSPPASSPSSLILHLGCATGVANSKQKI